MNRPHLLLPLVAMSAILCARVFSQDLNDLPPVAVNQADQIESQVPGQIQIVRWDMLLNQAGADALKKVAQPVDSASKTFQAMTCNGFELRQAMADAMANNGVERVSRDMRYASNSPGTGGWLPPIYLDNYSPDPIARHNLQVWCYARQGEDVFTQETGDKIKIKLDEPDVNIRIAEQSRNRTIGGGSISVKYEGDLIAGDAVVMLAPFTTPSKANYFEMVVWETFKADDRAMQLMQAQRDSGWWCQNGPATVRRWAAGVEIWESHADHEAEDVPAAFSQTLEDGKEVRLLGLCRPSEAPFCWWDADGKPIRNVSNISINYTGGPPAGLWAQVEIKGKGPQFRIENGPATQPMHPANPGDLPESKTFQQYACTQLPDGADKLEAGVGVGPWREIAQMNFNDEKQADGITYKLGTGSLEGKSTFIFAFNHDDDANNLTALSPVGIDGKETNYSGEEPFLVLSRKDINPFQNIYTDVQGMAMGDVQYFRLCLCKRQWVSFSGFATKPDTPLNGDAASTTRQ
jgi:hypothetical protein